jgi:hypothetical protein
MTDPNASSQRAAPVAYYTRVDVNDVRNPTRLDLVRDPQSPTPPEAMRILSRGIQEVGRLVTTVFSFDPALRKKFFEELHITADVGLVGSNFNTDTGLDNLAEVKGNIADQFPAIRTHYWRTYARYVVNSAVLLILGGLIYYLGTVGWCFGPKPAPDGDYHPLVIMAIAAFWIPVGVAIGLFLEYNSRVDTNIPYEKLQSINAARWDPFQRFVNTVLSGYVFATIMGIGIVQVGVSSILLNNFATKQPYLALVIGFVTGFAAPYVQDIISQTRPVTRGAPQSQ